MPPATDLTGRVYGRLRVARRCTPFAGRPRWWCECRCGWVGVRTAAALAMRPESCGCLQAEIAAETMRAVRDPKAGTLTRRDRVCAECRTPFVGHHAATYCSAGCWTASRSRKRQQLRTGRAAEQSARLATELHQRATDERPDPPTE